MPRDEDAPAIRALTRALWQAWTKAGPVSYAEFEKVSRRVLGGGQYLAKSTVQGHLMNPGNRQPARWDWLHQFWRVVRVLATEHGIDPDSLGTLEALKHLHEAADAEALLARRPAKAANPGRAAEPPPYAAHDVTLGAARFPGDPRAQLADGANARTEEVLAAIRQRVGQEWWHDYRDVVPDWFETYLSLEPAASRICVYDTAVVPSLLQTEAYARSVLRLDPFALPEAAISRMVQLRMQRQQLIGRSEGPQLWAILDESALRYQPVEASVMHGQIAHLLEISGHSNVTIQVIPSVAARRTLGYPLTLLRFRVHEVPDVAYFEPLTTAIYLHDPVHVSRVRAVQEGLVLEALPPAETAAYLGQLLLEV